MFISKTVIFVQYIDDCLCFYCDQKESDKVFQLLLDDGYKYNWEISVYVAVTEYLGIGIGEVRTNKVKLGYHITQ